MNCLIFGGNASIANEISKIFFKNGYTIITASRSISDIGDSEFEFSKRENGESKILQINEICEVDVLIFCIGKLYGKALGDYLQDEIYDSFDSNVITVAKSYQLFSPALSNNASVIFLSSIAASAGSYDEVYSASKSALHGLTKSLARKSPNGIRVNCIAPGLIADSAMSHKFTNKEIEKHRVETPIKRLVSKEEIARIIFDVCQPHWSSLNGHILNINGGRYV